jgi:RHS repeat-associated protein
VQEETNFGFVRADPMKFTGHERDLQGVTNVENSDYLDYMNARYYHPTWRRFLSVDSLLPTDAIKEPQRWNRYAYVANNPVRNTDPTGKLLQVAASPCDEETTCYSKVDSFQALKEWVGPKAAQHLVLAQNGQVTLAKGMSFAQFAKFGSAAGIAANLMRSTSNTATLMLTANAKDDHGNPTSAYTHPAANGTRTEINPAMLPRMEGGVVQTMDTTLVHELGGHGLQDMWGVSVFDRSYGSMDQRVTWGVQYGEAFAMTMENIYGASQTMDIRGYYMNSGDYNAP